jgi:hypothetical protein
MIKKLQNALVAMTWRRADVTKEKQCILILPSVKLACRHLVEKKVEKG